MSQGEKLNDSEVASRAERGRRAREHGLNFEDRVAEIYRLLHYTVESGRLFCARQVDLFLTGHFGDLTVWRAIECKVGPVVVGDLDAFISKLRLVRRDYPAAQGTIISAVSFSDAVAEHAFQEGITLTLFRDLTTQLLDGHQYAAHIIASCESSEQYPLSLYIEHQIGWAPTGESIGMRSLVREWLEDSSWNQLTLLGDVGTGKSFLCRVLAYDLAKAFLANPLQSPLPILIDLRNADRLFSLEGLILTHLSTSGLARASFPVFEHALRHGNIVLILDGFDEMSSKVAPFVTVRNFHELAKCVKGQAKVLLTCRTHYFKSRTEEEEVVLGGGQDLPSEGARELYWDLISRNGFRLAYVRPFTLPQIEKYLRLRRPKDFKHALAKIRTTYNLLELSQRPMLLEMIVKTLDKIEVSSINSAALYKIYTDAWIQRDHWRDVLTAEKKLSFLTRLALTLWSEDATRIHYSALQECLRSEFAGELQDPLRLVEIDSEVRTASFLTRDSSGYYEFAHKSYSEFFLARSLAVELSRCDLDCLRIRRLSPEVVSFLFDLVDHSAVAQALEGGLAGQYVPLLSENILIVLYGLRREKWLRMRQHDGEMLRVPMPFGVNLSGADLRQVSLEGIVLRGARLQGANLENAVLAYSDLSASKFDHATLKATIMTKADMTGTSLLEANLVATNLVGVVLDGSQMQGADLSNADLSGASAVGVDWKTVKVDGAAFSTDLAGVVRGPIEVFLKQAAHAGKSESVEFWTDIDKLLPRMRAIARKVTLRGSIEADDIVSELFIELIMRGHGKEFLSMDEKESEAFLSMRLYQIAKILGSRVARREASQFSYGVLENVTGGGGEDLQSLAWISDERQDPLAGALEKEIYSLMRKAVAVTEFDLSEKFSIKCGRY